MTKLLTILCLLLIVFTGSLAQVHHYFINPDSTQAGMKKTYSGHLVTVNRDVKQNGKLFITIPGTGSNPQGLKQIDSIAACLGYHVIGLDYPNRVNTANFVNSTDIAAFDKFRQELNFGTPVCDSVMVDTLNSISNRIIKLITYLAKTRLDEGWAPFLSGNQIKWRKVVLAGHSQGAGHVAYLGHHYKVHKVIMLSGPQDFLAGFNRPAPWLSSPSKTPAKRYWSLLHVNDMYNTNRQTRNDLTTMRADSLVINHFTLVPVYKRKQRLFISDAPMTAATVPVNKQGAANHGASTRVAYSEVWKYLLKN